ncbi:MAG: WbqC family protein [Planctomycetales bacterium]|nr:WbqC family protein [Planctomycetales bacterium]
MRLAIMQPYFLPYIGYWQLMASVDTFVVYDNIKYTKKGWINRNRMLLNGQATTFSLPLARDRDELDVMERRLAESYQREKLLARLDGAYRKAPHFAEVRPLMERVVMHPSDNLFVYLWNSIHCVSEHLGLTTALVRSSEINVDHGLKAKDKVQAICQALDATAYVNPIGGQELYESRDFGEHGIQLQFIRSLWAPYLQWPGQSHVPWLSVVDVLMFNPLLKVQAALQTDRELL